MRKWIVLLSLTLPITALQAHEAIADLACKSQDGQVKVLASPTDLSKSTYKVFVKKGDKLVYKDLKSQLTSKDLMKEDQTHGDQFDFTLKGGDIRIWAEHREGSEPRAATGTLKLTAEKMEVPINCQLKLHL